MKPTQTFCKIGIAILEDNLQFRHDLIHFLDGSGYTVRLPNIAARLNQGGPCTVHEFANGRAV